MSNVYHIIHFKPEIDKENLFIGYENLAQKLVKSGRFRIDGGDDKINFARLYVPDLNISMMFSYREIYDEELADITERTISTRISEFTSGAPLKAKVNQYMGILESEIKKYTQPTPDEEIKLARLVVQATHPVVMELLLIDRAEIFLSFSHNIGDVLDIPTWQTSGSNSGMQSLSGRDRSIFISCGGNPLKANEDPTAEYGNGKPAIARIMIIGGQEMGHYSDIKRDKTGAQVMDRYSADIYCTHAKPEVKEGRIHDIKKSNLILKKLIDAGLFQIMKMESGIKFYRQMKKTGIGVMIEHLKLFFHRLKFNHNTHKAGLSGLISRFSGDEYPANAMHTVIMDMLFNLAPKADVYSSPDKDVEEAIACVEALARVPQQVNKWGKYLTKIFMENLYNTYYTKVIPGCITAYQSLTGKPFTFDKNLPSFSSRLVARIKKIFGRE